MLGPYADILRVPGARGFVLAGLVARLQMAIVGLGAVLLIKHTTGSYGLAGAVSATIAVANAIGSPQIGRLADRFGQVRVLPAALAVHAVGVLAVLTTALLDAPRPALFGAAIVAGGAFPSFGALVRSRWTHLLDGGDELQTAYALESVIDEFVFTVGPVLATVLATVVAPPAALAAGLALVLSGGSALAAQRTTEPPVVDRGPRPPSALRARGLVVLALVLIGVGGVFGTLEVAMVAFADERGHQIAAGPLLALHAVASGLAGIAYGARRWGLPLHRRLPLAIVVLCVGTVPLALAETLPTMALATALSGITISPVLITCFALVETLVPRGALTEGFAWLSTALAAGVAIGLAVGGQAVDAAGGHRAFVVAVGASVLGGIVALAGRRRLAPER